MKELSMTSSLPAAVPGGSQHKTCSEWRRPSGTWWRSTVSGVWAWQPWLQMLFSWKPWWTPDSSWQMGKITDTEFNRKLKESDFGMIRSYGTNPFSRNYAQFIDNAADPRRVCRRMGVDNNVPALLKVGGRAVGRVAQLTTQVYKNVGFALKRKFL